MHALTVFRTEAPNNLKELTSLMQVQSQIHSRRIKMRLALICIALCLLLSLVEANPQRGGGGRRGGGGGLPPVSLENVMLYKRSTKTSWSQFSSRIKIAVAQDCIVFLLTSVLNMKIFQLFLSMCHITFCICDQFPITIFVCVLWKPRHWVDHRENVKQRKCNY